MAMISVKCPHCGSEKVAKSGKQEVSSEVWGSTKVFLCQQLLRHSEIMPNKRIQTSF